MSTADCLDSQALERLYRLGGEKLVLGMIVAFLGTTPVRVREARAAAAAGDLVPLGRAMHSLKVTAANFGARRLPPLAARLEQAALAGDAAAVAAELEEMTASLDELVARLELERQRIAP